MAVSDYIGIIVILISIIIIIVFVTIWWNSIGNFFQSIGNFFQIALGGGGTVPPQASACMATDTNLTACCNPGGFFYNNFSQNPTWNSMPETQKECVCMTLSCDAQKTNNLPTPPICANYPYSSTACT